MFLIISLVAVIAVTRLIAFLIERRVTPATLTKGLDTMETAKAIEEAWSGRTLSRKGLAATVVVSTVAIAIFVWAVMGSGFSGFMLFLAWYVMVGGLSWIINGVSAHESSVINTLPGAISTIILWPLLVSSSLYILCSGKAKTAV